MAEIRYEESILIAAAPEEVFDFRIDFTTLPQYNPNVSNLKRVDAGTGHEPGAEFLFNLQLAGAPEPIESPLRLTTVERPTSFSYETGPGFMAEGLCTFEAKDGGTLVTTETTETNIATARSFFMASHSYANEVQTFSLNQRG